MDNTRSFSDSTLLLCYYQCFHFLDSRFFAAICAHFSTMYTWYSGNTAETILYPLGKLFALCAIHTRLTACETAPVDKPSSFTNTICFFPSTRTPCAISSVCSPTFKPWIHS